MANDSHDPLFYAGGILKNFTQGIKVWTLLHKDSETGDVLDYGWPIREYNYSKWILPDLDGPNDPSKECYVMRLINKTRDP